MAVLVDAKLLEAAPGVVAGEYDADIRGGVFKRRVAREGRGKPGGFRTIILFQIGSQSFFADGFVKSDKANVSATELKTLKRFAHVLLGFSGEPIEAAQAVGELVEV